MAKATVTCTCETCGKLFERNAYKRKMYDTIRALQELGFNVTAPTGVNLDAWIDTMEAKK